MLVCLHIGCEKTGTTSIQEYLQRRATDIAAAGWALPEAGRFPNATRLALTCLEPGSGDGNVARLDARDGGRERRNWRAETWSAIGQELAPREGDVPRAILSSEYFQSKLESEEEIERLRDNFRMAGATGFRIIVYLRRQLEYAISRYSTALRAGYERREILPQLAGGCPVLFDYESLLDRWSAVFGADALAVRLYERSCLVNGDVVDDFARTVGLPEERQDLPRSPRRNTGLSIAAQLVIRSLNEALANRNVSREDSARLRRAVLRRLEELPAGASMTPSRDQAIEFQSRFDEANARVARRWFARDTLFDDVFDYPPEPRDGRESEAVASAFAESVVDLLEPPPPGRGR